MCIPVSFGWNDVGGYNALPEVLGISHEGHTSNTHQYVYIDSKNNIVITDDTSKKSKYHWCFKYRHCVIKRCITDLS